MTALSRIIRDGVDGKRSLVSEVDVLKLAADRHEKHLEEVARGFDIEIGKLSASFFGQLKEMKDGMEKAEADRRADETAKIRLQLEDRKDLRLDKRSRLSTWVSVALAILALVGTVVTYLITRSGK